MQNLLNDLKHLLEKDGRFVVDGELLRNKVIEFALKDDIPLLEILLSHRRLREHFFTEIKDKLIFKKDIFLRFVNNKYFLPDCYTSYKIQIGLTHNDQYFSEKGDIVIAFPYKDSILEGGQIKEEVEGNRPEIFWNETLAPDEVDRLLDSKVLTNFKKINEKGEETKVTEIKSTDNLIIRGNNLLALHSLKRKFRDRVKLIYLDPPYNTGGDTFNYNDRFNHSSWLTFMNNRLKVAKSFLDTKGAIFVQIDYHELGYLLVLMDEIFGKENFIQLITIKTSSTAGYKTVNPGPIEVTEYLLFYAKNRREFNFKKAYVPVEYDDNYNRVIINPEDKPEKWKLRPLTDIVYEENGIDLGTSSSTANKNAEKKWGKYWKTIRQQVKAEYALKNSDRVVSIRDPHKPPDTLKRYLEKSREEDEKDKVFVYPKSNEVDQMYIINGGALSFYSNKIKEIDGERKPTELLTGLWTDISWDGIASEGGVKLKNGKKPEKLLRRIIDISTEPKDIVLDFFLGSGTTCAVAHKTGRQYIGIEQIDYGPNDAVVRLKNVIKGDSTGISKFVDWKGGGSFTYCELMEWNQKFVNQIQKSKTKDEIKKIWKVMKEKSFISYKLDIKQFDKNASDFGELDLDNQKKFLFEVLDKNELYVNLSEIDDEDFAVSGKDKDFNSKFYGVGLS